MSSHASPPASPPTEQNGVRFKYPIDDPRLRPSSASPAAQATFMRRLGRIRASQPAISTQGRISKGIGLSLNIFIPMMLVYAIFLEDWGPNEHVFSGPQRWLKRKKEAFWSLPTDDKPVSNAALVDSAR